MRREQSTRLKRQPFVTVALLLSVLATAAGGQTWPQPQAAAVLTPIERAQLSQGTLASSATGQLPSTFGTQDRSVEIFPSAAFDTLFNMAYENAGDGYRSSGIFTAGVQLPDGALIDAIEVEACDTADDDHVLALLASCGPTAAGSCDAVGGKPDGVLVTGIADTPGCSRFGLVYESPVTVDNRNYTLFFQVAAQSGLDLSFRAARIFWRRQVSPAPATATFGDVPTDHPFFQHIEALVASGITAGCGDDDFCPGASLTRGQMAVFLAKALGLHWGEF